jgi:hypothetical protein
MATSVAVDQLSVPHIEAYPNQPSSYTYFDYKQRALDYDAFIYDWSQPGDFWTIRWDTNHVNTTFDTIVIPSYHGDARFDSDSNQESIVQMANIVGAKLVGVSKDSYPADVGKGKAVHVSSEVTGYSGSLAVDNDKNTYWTASSTGVEWIYVDLVTSRTIDRIILDWVSDRHAESFVIQTSDDAYNWTTVHTETLGSGGKEIIDLSPVSARYARMHATEAAVDAYGLYSFGIYSDVDYIALLQHFFQDSQTLFLPGNKSGPGGLSWWYDTLPVNLFYMIGDQYPDHDLVLEKQQGIADNLYDMIVTLGGATASFEHTAFDRINEQPYNKPNGIIEPDAGIGIALVLYWAYIKFGDERYLDGARWSMEFFERYNNNPYYELLTAFGPYLAARMNADLNERYDVSRYFGWLFGNSDARPGWGTVSGTWNGIEVNGLTGSQTDRGGYGFPMNTYLNAFLAPVVKYDQRYARVVGKYLLNASHNLKVTYPDQIATSRQYHGSRFVDAPENVLPYEGFIRYENDPAVSMPEGSAFGDPVLYKELWGTGDDITNLSIYSAAYVGFFGGLFEETNVSQILQVDVNKLDFYEDSSYPTYLYYNPYSTAQSVEITLDSSSDLFNAVSGSFLAQNVSGVQSFSIPADSAVVLVVAPPNSSLSYSENKTLIDDVPVAYNPYYHAGMNLAYGRAVQSSSDERSSSIASNAVNGKDHDHWSSLFGSSEFIYVDLGGSMNFDQVVLRWSDQSANKPYKVQVSDDTVSWTDVYSGNAGAEDILTFPSVNKRYVRMLGSQGATSSGVEDFSNVSDWNVGANASISTSGGIATVTNTSGDYGSVYKNGVTYNVDTYPSLKVVIPEVGAGAQWVLQVNDGTTTYYVQTNNGLAGTYYYNLKNITGWSGTKTMTFYLLAIGGSGKYFTIDDITAYSTDNYKIKEFEVYKTSSLLSDNFNNGNDDGWVVSSGTWVVDTLQYKGTGAGGQDYTLTGNTNWTDYVLNAKVKLDGGSNDAGIAVRVQDANNLYLFKIAYNAMEIYKVMGGSYTALASVAASIPTGNYYDYKVIVSDNRIHVYKDGQLQLSVTDDTFRGGKIGLRSAGTSVTWFDDITVKALRAKSPVAFTMRENFNHVDDWFDGIEATITSSGGVATVTNTSGTFGIISKNLGYNLDDQPIMQVKVTEMGSGSMWALKVDDGVTNHYLQGNTAETGTFHYNIKRITGWSGYKEFRVQLLPIGGTGEYVKFDEILSRHALVLEDFQSISDWGWATAADMSVTSNVATVTNTSGTFGIVSKYTSVNVDTYSHLQIRVPEVGSGAMWALKVDDGASSYYLQGNTSGTGTFLYDLKDITGWSGNKTFQVQLLPIGGSAKFFKVEEILLFQP